MKPALRIAGCLPLTLLALGIAGCQSSTVPTLTPLVVGNSGQTTQPILVSGKLDAGTMNASGFYAPPELGGIADPGLAAAINLAAAPGIASIPGVPSVWYDVRDIPFSRRSDFVSRIDTSLTLANGALNTANVSSAKPGLEAEHAAAVRQLQQAIDALTQERATLTTSDSFSWDRNKDDFNAAWQNAESAYARASATGF